MKMRRVVSLFLTLTVLLTCVSATYSQSSTISTQAQIERDRLITKSYLAANEVIKARQYIEELEANAVYAEAQIKKLEEAGSKDAELIKTLKTQADEYRQGAEAYKQALAERLKELGLMQQKLNKSEAGRRFWKKIAKVTIAISAALTAAVVMRK